MNNKNQLTQQQRRFAANYAQTLDPIKSALDAGYKRNSAKSRANELLKNPRVILEINAQIDFLASTFQITNAFIVKKLLQIISATSESEVITDKNGNPTGGIKLKDPAVALRAVDCLFKLFCRESTEQTAQIADSVRVMCIENLNEEKI